MVGAPSFSKPYFAYKHPNNLHQKSVPLLYSIFTCLSHLYLFTKSFLQSPLTLPFSIIQQFFTSLFLHTTIPTIYTKNISLPQPFRQFRLPRGTRELGSLARNNTVLISLSSSSKY